MTTLSGISITIDGQPVDLAEVDWYEKAPCGCVCGATVAYSAYGKGTARVIATAEQAIAEFWETTHLRKKYVDQLGFSVFADRRSKVQEYLSVKCPHDPKYGIPPRPEVDGYKWAAVYDATARPKLMHLVSDGALEDARERRYGSDRGTPLCGGKRHFWWSTEPHALHDKVECARCIRKATAAKAVPA